MISEQYYLLENSIKLNPNSKVFEILNPLEELTGWKTFFLNKLDNLNLLIGVNEEIKQFIIYYKKYGK